MSIECDRFKTYSFKKVVITYLKLIASIKGYVGFYVIIDSLNRIIRCQFAISKFKTTPLNRRTDVCHVVRVYKTKKTRGRPLKHCYVQFRNDTAKNLLSATQSFLTWKLLVCIRTNLMAVFFSGRRVFRFSPSSRFCSFRKLLITTPARIAWKLYLVQRLKTKRRLMEAERGGTGSWCGAVVLHEYN